LPFCPNCGATVDGEDIVCLNCGKKLYPEPIKNRGANFGYPPKPSTNVSNGILIGGSSAVIISCLLLLNSLNSNYWSQWNFMISQGIQRNEASYQLLSIVGVISLSGAALVYACYILISSLLRQFNPKIRAIIDYREAKKATYGNGFVSGGAIAIAFTLQNILFYSYPSASTPDRYFQVGFGVGGTVLIIAGVLLLSSFYRDSRNLAKKFIAQTPVPVNGSER
jgi:multisubunit Na+/H+ antiporter MnhB subunit